MPRRLPSSALDSQTILTASGTGAVLAANWYIGTSGLGTGATGTDQVVGTLNGPLTGTADSAKALTPGKALNGTTFTGSLDITVPVNTTSIATSGVYYPLFVPSSTAGNQQASTSVASGFTFDPNTKNLVVAGTVTGSNLSGTNTGDQTTLPHNGTALIATTGTFSGTVTLPSITAVDATAITITGAPSTTPSGTAYAVNITGGTGTDGAVAGRGGAINITGGRSGNNSTGPVSVMGGVVAITGGAGNTLNNGSAPGGVTIFGGPPQIAGQRGADVNIAASGGFSSATSADGGNLYLTAGGGTSSGGANGFVQISAPGGGAGADAQITFIATSTERARINRYGLSVGTTANASATAGTGAILAAGDITVASGAFFRGNGSQLTNLPFPVTSVNGQTGAVTVTSGVTSVNGSTGAVTVSTLYDSFNVSYFNVQQMYKSLSIQPGGYLGDKFASTGLQNITGITITNFSSDGGTDEGGTFSYTVSFSITYSNAWFETYAPGYDPSHLRMVVVRQGDFAYGTHWTGYPTTTTWTISSNPPTFRTTQSLAGFPVANMTSTTNVTWTTNDGTYVSGRGASPYIWPSSLKLTTYYAR